MDGQDGIRTPIGMHGYRLEVEAHIITASQTTVENLRQCVQAAGVEVNQFVLNPLASGEVVLTETERQMGVVVCDIGGGTTDMAIYIDGDVWHTMVIALGGNHITSDIAHGLRLSLEQAEEVKKAHGHALEREVSPEEAITIHLRRRRPQTGQPPRAGHDHRGRAEEIFQHVRRRSSAPVMTACCRLAWCDRGASLLPALRPLASQVLGLPVRLARPENLMGLTDQLNSPAYSTSVGLLYWALLMSEASVPSLRGRHRNQGGVIDWESVKSFFKRLLP